MALRNRWRAIYMQTLKYTNIDEEWLKHKYYNQTETKL